ncbi:PadR family transcriptional regulator [Clostridium cochlearium]|uniref:PadR family transcriptional regulator n=2 Tax=Clostridium cochlearium TaxID=1494 RepID=A0A7Y4DEF1_CLOCO|nr:PadR family transcriptional regulator [Clostridium cochlearium]NOH16846.1 PadR family transcriptional regulator [Clostridium cochlearium]
MDIDKELLKGSTQTLVLTLIQKQPMYGYEIIKKLEEKSSGIFKFKEGTLYPILHGLEAMGIIESFWNKGDNGRNRKYYRITKKGNGYLKEKKEEWSTFRVAVDNILWEAVLWE